jgi:hypothetical protein
VGGVRGTCHIEYEEEIYSGWPSCERSGALCTLARDEGGCQCAQSHGVDSTLLFFRRGVSWNCKKAQVLL